MLYKCKSGTTAAKKKTKAYHDFSDSSGGDTITFFRLFELLDGDMDTFVSRELALGQEDEPISPFTDLPNELILLQPSRARSLGGIHHRHTHTDTLSLSLVLSLLCFCVCVCVSLSTLFLC